MPLLIAVVVQSNQAVRSYLPFISKVGSILDDSLGALTGETALITYNDEITLSKPFGKEDLQTALRRIVPSGGPSRLVDAGLLGLELLRNRSGNRSRFLSSLGQSYDSGSQQKLDSLTHVAKREGAQIYALKLPLAGRSFVSDTFRLQGLGSQGYRGGYQASIELTKAIPFAKRVGETLSGNDPFSQLTSLTGGFVIQFRLQRDLEDAVLTMGDALRSRYFLSFVQLPVTVDFTASPYTLRCPPPEFMPDRNTAHRTRCSDLDIQLAILLRSAKHAKGAPRPRKGIIPPLHFGLSTIHSLLA